MNVDKDLTVVLFLKDRTPFTYRWLRYYNETHFPFKILIADGGKDRTISELLSDKSNYPNLDYQYKLYPYDENYAIYHAKKADVMSRVETPFVVITDNDDFLIVESLRESVRFLRDHEDYAACGGDLFAFVLQPDINALSCSSMSLIHQPPPGSIELKTASERVLHHFEHYFTTYYDVHRADDSRGLYSKLNEVSPLDTTISELLTSFMTVASGKVKKQPYPYLLRQYHLDTNCYKEDMMHDRFDRMFWETWSYEFNMFLETVAKIIASRDQVDLDYSSRIVKEGYRKYIAPIIIPCLSNGTDAEPSIFLHRLKLFIHKSKRSILSWVGIKPAELNSTASTLLCRNDEVNNIRNFLMEKPL